ncbi:MAG: MFS transporter [Chitinophagaceae bacterium]|nr:MAG: MFS transporter [Chitinophagaceae bacterium]
MQTASKKVINGWAMYDWANSVYNLVITTTFFPIYFAAATRDHFGSDHIPFLNRSFVNTALYDYSLCGAYLVIALLYPILTSISDTRGNKKQFMQFFCYLGAVSCSCLYFFDGANVGVGVGFFILAAIGYSGSLVFYNSYLPEIAAEKDRDRISARGYSLGYVGSVILQIIGFALVMTLASAGDASRITFLLVGAWWAVFAQFTFRVLPAQQTGFTKTGSNIFKDGFHQMKNVYGQVKKMPVLKRLLRGFFFYSMGVQTVMLAATLFGSKALGLNETKLIITVVLIQLVAIAGAWSMSRLSGKFGNFRVLIAVVIFWIVVCLAAYYTAQLKEQGHDPENYFYILAICVGLVMGGIQSLSRSTFAKLMPETTKTASFFCYYDFTEKIAIAIGILSFGLIEELTHDHGGMKNSILSLIVFFVLGLMWLYSALRKQRQLKPVYS